jgi:EF hand domain-containing protein
MRKFVLGMSAVALCASAAAFAADPDDTRVATAESMTPSFSKLDTDGDGRVSAIEAAGNSRVAAGFTAADANRDGYLSKAEYAQLEKMPNPTAAPSSTERSLPSDKPATEPPPQ